MAGRSLGLWLIVLSLPAGAFAQGTGVLSPAIGRLSRAIERGDQDAERRWWVETQAAGIPIVELDSANPEARLLTFLFRGSAASPGPRLVSNLNAVQLQGITLDFFGDSSLGRFSLVPGSNTWHATYRVPATLRAPYLIAVSSADTAGLNLTRAAGSAGYLDPGNPGIFGRGIGGVEASMVALDLAPAQPWRGMAFEPVFDTIPLPGTGPKRFILVWRPPSGRNADSGDPLLIAIAPWTFVERIPTAGMLRHLIQTGEVRRTILVVVPEPDGSDEIRRYAGNTAFLADTVLPTIRSRYRVSTNPQDIVVTGTSRRGLAAAIAVVDRPDQIGAALTLSGSFYWAPPGTERLEWLAARLAREDRKPIRWFIAVGSLESVVTSGNRGHYMVATNRHLNDVLVAKGYNPGYHEFAGVHHEANWEDALAAGLRTLLRPPIAAEPPLGPSPSGAHPKGDAR